MLDEIEELKEDEVSDEKTETRNKLTAKRDRYMKFATNHIFRILAIKLLNQLVPASIHTGEDYERALGAVIDATLGNQNQP